MWRSSVKVGDLVRKRHTSYAGWTEDNDFRIGLIVKIEEIYLMALKTQSAILNTGESFPLHELEVINESR